MKSLLDIHCVQTVFSLILLLTKQYVIATHFIHFLIMIIAFAACTQIQENELKMNEISLTIS